MNLKEILLTSCFILASCATPKYETPKYEIQTKEQKEYTLEELFTEENRFTWDNSTYIPGIWVGKEGNLGELEHKLKTGEIIFIIKDGEELRKVEDVEIKYYEKTREATIKWENHETVPRDEYNVDFRTWPNGGFFYARPNS